MWYWRKILVGLTIPTAVSLLWGIVWSVVKGSIQDGFSISSYVVTTLAVVIAYTGIYAYTVLD